MRYLSPPSPIVGIKFLDQKMHVTEIVRLSVVSHIILDAGTKFMVEGMMEGIITITNLADVLVE